jgi:enoyl-CoA hydratase
MLVPEEFHMPIAYSNREGHAEIAIDDGRVNVMDVPFFQALTESLERAEAERVTSLLITGRPGVLSAGLDLNIVQALTREEFPGFGAAFGRAMLKVWTCKVPTLAVCTGHAIAGGAILAFACDRRIALDGEYRIQMNESRNRMSLPSWALEICQSALPSVHWNRVLMHAQAYSPGEAFEAGFFEELVEAGGDVLARGREMARSFEGIHLRSYAVTKQRMRGPAAERALALFDHEI